VIWKVSIQANTLDGDVFTDGEFGVTDIERLRVTFLVTGSRI
jgi:hypothetical protein